MFLWSTSLKLQFTSCFQKCQRQVRISTCWLMLSRFFSSWWRPTPAFWSSCLTKNWLIILHMMISQPLKKSSRLISWYTPPLPSQLSIKQWPLVVFFAVQKQSKASSLTKLTPHSHWLAPIPQNLHWSRCPQTWSHLGGWESPLHPSQDHSSTLPEGYPWGWPLVSQNHPTRSHCPWRQCAGPLPTGHG